MAKISESAEGVKRLREFLGETRDQFAQHFNVKPPTISAWESGEEVYAPGIGAYLALANVAAEHGLIEEALLFLEKAGLKEATVLATAGKLTKIELSDRARWFLCRLPERTLWVEVDEKNAGGGFTKGDALAFLPVTELPELRDQIVLAELRPPPRSEMNWMEEHWGDGGYRIGKLVWEPYRREENFWVAWLRGVGERAQSYASAEVAIPIGGKEGSGGREPAIELRQGCKIYGRAIAWLRIPAVRK